MTTTQVAVITGASRGIGLEIAHRFVAAGGRVCITARGADELDRAVHSLGQDVAVASRGRADDREHQAATMDIALSAFGRIDVLVNNAATNAQVGPLVESDLESVAKTFAVNLFGVLGFSQQVWSLWMREHGGSIVNVSSVAGLRATPMTGAYNVSKAALLHMTRQLAIEMGPIVRVNAVTCGLVPTQFSASLVEDQVDLLDQAHPMRRMGNPSDVAQAVTWLASDAAGWITGASLVIDGGGSLTDVGELASRRLAREFGVPND